MEENTFDLAALKWENLPTRGVLIAVKSRHYWLILWYPTVKPECCLSYESDCSKLVVQTERYWSSSVGLGCFW